MNCKNAAAHHLWCHPVAGGTQRFIVVEGKKTYCLIFLQYCQHPPAEKRPGASLERSRGRPYQPGGTQEGAWGLYRSQPPSLDWRQPGFPWAPEDQPPASVDGPEKSTTLPFEQSPPLPPPSPPPFLLRPHSLSVFLSLSLSPLAHFLCGPNEWFI